MDVEVTNAADEVLPGFSRAECDRFRSDSVHHIVGWNRHSEIPTLPAVENRQFSVRRLGSPYAPAGHRKLRFYLRDADLYSFTFEWPTADHQPS